MWLVSRGRVYAEFALFGSFKSGGGSKMTQRAIDT